MNKLNEQQTEKLLGIVNQAINDFAELGQLRQDYASVRKFPLGSNCSSFRAVLQSEVTSKIDAMTEHRLGFFLSDLNEFLTENGLRT